MAMGAGGAGGQVQNAQQYNQMYRTWRQTMHQKSGGSQPPAPNDDLKNFYIKVALNKETIKAVSTFMWLFSGIWFDFPAN